MRSAQKGTSSLNTQTQNINAGLHLNTMSNGNRKEISLRVCELTAETMVLPPYPEMTGFRLWRNTGQASCRIRALYFQFKMDVEKLEKSQWRLLRSLRAWD